MPSGADLDGRGRNFGGGGSSNGGSQGQGGSQGSGGSSSSSGTSASSGGTSSSASSKGTTQGGSFGIGSRASRQASRGGFLGPKSSSGGFLGGLFDFGSDDEKAPSQLSVVHGDYAEKGFFEKAVDSVVDSVTSPLGLLSLGTKALSLATPLGLPALALGLVSTGASIANTTDQLGLTSINKSISNSLQSKPSVASSSQLAVVHGDYGLSPNAPTQGVKGGYDYFDDETPAFQQQSLAQAQANIAPNIDASVARNWDYSTRTRAVNEPFTLSLANRPRLRGGFLPSIGV
ncbi:MAG: hypothetical protein AAF403_00580 [Pseudomonadota bacterium]